MEKKTAMNLLIEKILRMPESNIKFFLKTTGPSYLELEEEQIMKAYERHYPYSGRSVAAKLYYNETYGK